MKQEDVKAATDRAYF